MRPVALVTGGAVRLGRSICLHLAKNGYDIALHYNTSRTEAVDTAHEIEAAGAQCKLFQADLADSENYQLLIGAVAKEFPDFSVLINSASIFDRGPFMQSDKALFDKEYAVNLIAPIFLTQAFAHQQQQGCVINLLDTAVSKNTYPYFFYLMSKKSLLDFTKMAAVELAPDIRVNGICPGYILPAEGYGESYKEKLEARLPMKKIATPEAVAQAVFLMINNPSLTGQILYVDGGESLL